jgi:acyl phosphate:glycerol-3-phosphate acyltransferase
MTPSLAIDAAVVVMGYLLGSIPFGYILVRIFRRQDVRASGSGNIGATNVARSGGTALGIATLALDLVKGYLAVAIAFLLGARMYGPFSDANAVLVALAACAAILGHVFPAWLGFRGGKGVATALGIFLFIEWRAALATALLFLIIFAISRIVSLSSIIAAASFPALAIWLSAVRPLPRPILFAMLAIPALIIVKHHANIARLINGTEHRFGSDKRDLGLA